MMQKKLANLFSSSVSTIKKWSAEGFPSKGELQEQIAWVRENRPLASSAITDARTRKINAEARLKEFELMIKEGQLIPRAEVLEMFLWRVQTVKSGLMSLHKTLIHQLSGHDQNEWALIIKKACLDLLARYSRRSGILKKGRR